MLASTPPDLLGTAPVHLDTLGVQKLEPEPQDGPTEYKLHLLLRPRRSFTSSTTAHLLSGSQHSRSRLPAGASPRQSPTLTAARPAHPAANQTRQNRLQQLTTQLLWRLQQSSPFHSSSSAMRLVFPILPDVTNSLNTPNQLARLLPSLEESQGALYEIGVSDDGYFVGLTEDELNESLANLKAMAASLGCAVEILKKVVVGSCEWIEVLPEASSGQTTEKRLSADLLVAEALVRPDLHSRPLEDTVLLPEQLRLKAEQHTSIRKQEESESTIEQLRLSLVGPSASGKSSLLGTLTSSLLDNGRGKSRLNLLKHRHEISSGITSSVAQDIVGYSASVRKSSLADASFEASVVNYATGDVTSWNDIHGLVSEGGRLVFVSDSPGLSRFSKSIIRTLVSWDPNWVVLCIAADEDEEAPSKAYLGLCTNLELPFVVAITKVDKTTKQGLKETLTRLLSALKATGAKPAILTGNVDLKPAENFSSSDLQNISAEDTTQARGIVSGSDWQRKRVVPIILTSAVSGLGITRLHSLIRELPIPRAQGTIGRTSLFYIDEVYTMPASKVYSGTATAASAGTILCGHLASGKISVGDKLLLGPFGSDTEDPASKGQVYHPCSVISLRNLRLPVHTLLPGQVGTIGVESIISTTTPKPRKGMILQSHSHALPASYTSFTAIFSSTIFSDSDSPPLILGGHALAYFHSVRVAVKVASVAFTDSDSPQPRFQMSEQSAGEGDGVFAFDDDMRQSETVNISFEFLSGVEWFRIGQRVLIMPNVVMTSETDVGGSGAGVKGLVGFVGRICGPT